MAKTTKEPKLEAVLEQTKNLAWFCLDSAFNIEKGLLLQITHLPRVGDTVLLSGNEYEQLRVNAEVGFYVDGYKYVTAVTHLRTNDGNEKVLISLSRYPIR